MPPICRQSYAVFLDTPARIEKFRLGKHILALQLQKRRIAYQLKIVICEHSRPQIFICAKILLLQLKKF
jgi:hypothetical protein